MGPKAKYLGRLERGEKKGGDGEKRGRFAASKLFSSLWRRARVIIARSTKQTDRFFFVNGVDASATNEHIR